MSALLDAALGYAARGIPVYPVHWPRPTRAGPAWPAPARAAPACDRPAKHPLVRHGVKDATIDPDRSAAGGSGGPRPTSAWPPASCFDALDIDGPAGLAALRQLARKRRTCGSRVRWWPRGAVAGTTGSPRPGSATAHPAASPTSTGAASVAAYWPHPAAMSPGGSYRWLVGLDQAPLPEVPAALRALLDPEPPTTTRPADPAGPADPTDRPHSATRTAAGSWPPSWPPSAGPPPASATAPSTGARSRSTATSRAALLDKEDVTLAFTTAALAIGLDRAEVGRTLASARTAGLANPRTVPAAPGL